MIRECLRKMGSSKRNLLTSILLLVVMGVFAVLTIFIVVDAINKKYYNDIKVEYEVQEESPNVILTFARNEGSKFSTDNTKVVLNEDKTKFRIDGTVPTIESGVVTNLDDLTSSDGREFYFFSTNSSFIDPQEDPENPNFIFSETDYRYYVSTADNPIWYDVPKSSENLTLYSVFLTPNVHNSDFANAPLNTITNAIVSHDVVDLPREAFEDNSYSRPSALTTVLLPDTLQSIGDEAFYNCYSLTSITIPEGVTSIGERAFYNCSSLTSITIPEGVTSIGDHAFSFCGSLTSIIIPESVTSIGDYAFYDCSSLETITFGDNSQLVTIGSSAFSYCSSLTSITIPEGVTSIGDFVFSGCSSLETVNFGENSKLTSIGWCAFHSCSSLTSIIIPSSVTSIGNSAFLNCYKLVEVYDLTGSEGLNITVGSGNNGYVGYYAVEIKKEEGVTGIYNTGDNDEYIMYENLKGNHYLVAYQGQGDDITLPTFDYGRTYSIKSYAFYEEDKLTSVTIPSSVTSIGDYAFYSCDSLTPITIPESVTSIGDYAFYRCSSLTSIIIPSSVTSIGRYAFRNCDNLTIYCEASSQPSEWSSYWNYSNIPVYWSGEWKMVDGVPVPIESGVEGVGYSDVGEDFGIGFDGLGFREELYFNDKRERKVV